MVVAERPFVAAHRTERTPVERRPARRRGGPRMCPGAAPSELRRAYPAPCTVPRSRVHRASQRSWRRAEPGVFSQPARRLRRHTAPCATQPGLRGPARARTRSTKCAPQRRLRSHSTPARCDDTPRTARHSQVCEDPPGAGRAARSAPRSAGCALTAHRHAATTHPALRDTARSASTRPGADAQHEVRLAAPAALSQHTGTLRRHTPHCATQLRLRGPRGAGCAARDALEPPLRTSGVPGASAARASAPRRPGRPWRSRPGRSRTPRRRCRRRCWSG